jgi:HEAT repeat protein
MVPPKGIRRGAATYLDTFPQAMRSTFLLIASSILLIITEKPVDASDSDLQKLLQEAHSDTASERLDAAEKLASIFYGHRDPEEKRVAVQELIALLQDKQWFVRLAATDSLKSASDPKTEPILVHALGVEQKDVVREHLTSTIAAIRSSNEYQLLQFEDRDPLKRQQAVTQWAYSSDEKFKKALIWRLNDPVNSIRMSAADALIQQHNPAVIDFEIALLERSDDEGTRQSAAYTLGKLRAAKAADPLFRALSDSATVRRAAAFALADIGDSRAVAALISILKDIYINEARDVSKALAKFGDPAESALIVAVHDSDERTRLNAIRALSFFRSVRAADALTPLLHDPSKAVRDEASDALERVNYNIGR